MTRLIVLLNLLSLISACQRPSRTYSPVGQAALVSHNKNSYDATLYVESRLAAHGFKSPGKYLQGKNDVYLDRDYNGPSGLVADLNAHHGCITFVISVTDGLEVDPSLGISIGRESFQRILLELGQDKSWEIRRDQICEP